MAEPAQQNVPEPVVAGPPAAIDPGPQDPPPEGLDAAHQEGREPPLLPNEDAATAPAVPLQDGNRAHAQDTEENDPPPELGTVTERLARARGWLADHVANARIWQVIAALCLAAAALVWINPLASPPPLPDGLAMAQSWNRQIARLDIQPVYPPTEDFAVGDILIAIANAQADTNLIGKSIRVGHLPLRDRIVEQSKFAPRFEPTVMTGATASAPRGGAGGEATVPGPDGGAQSPAVQVNIEDATSYDPDRITLKMVAFPGLALGRGGQDAVLAGASFMGLSTAGRSSEDVAIAIPRAWTYGVRPDEGAGLLVRWCNAAETADYCRDGPARDLMAYSFGPQLYEKGPDHRYANLLQVSLVTRVFLTRQMRTSRDSRDEREAIAAETSDGGGVESPVAADGANAADPLASNPPKSSSAGRSAPAPLAIAEPDGSSALRTSRRFSDKQSLAGVFERPLVFGFRSVNQFIPLEQAASDGSPSDPAKENVK